MTRLRALALLPLVLTLAAGCDKKPEEKKADDKKSDAKKTDAKKADEKKADAPKADEAKADEAKAEPAAAAAVVASPDMTKFLSTFDGTSDKVAAALKEFGSTPEVKDADMGMYNLKDPKVIAANGDCFTFEAASGMMVNSYEVCWAAGKIKSVADKGSK